MVHSSLTIFAVVALGVSSALAAPVVRQSNPSHFNNLQRPQKDDARAPYSYSSAHANAAPPVWLATTSTNSQTQLRKVPSFKFGDDPRYKGGDQPPVDQAGKDRAAVAVELAGVARNAFYERHQDKRPSPHGHSESVPATNTGAAHQDERPAQGHPVFSNGH